MRLSNNIRQNALGLNARQAGGGASPFYPAVSAIDMAAAAGSLKFPDGNQGPNAQYFPTQKAGLYQVDTNITVPASTQAHAIFAIVGYPRGARLVNANHGIFGNGGTGGQRFRLSCAAAAANTTGGIRSAFMGYKSSSTGSPAAPSSPTWTEDDALVVMFCDGAGVFQLDWYSLVDGTRYQGTPVSVANGTTTPFGSGFMVGGTNNDTAQFAADYVTLPVMWPGTISALGIATRAVTPTEWANIALGADIITTIGAGNLSYLRELKGTSASYSKPSGATSDNSSAMVEMTGAVTPGITLSPGRDLRRPGPTDYVRLNTIENWHVYPLMKGQTSRPVPFSGQASGSGTVSVKVYELGSGRVVRDWTVVGTISGGAFSGTVELPKSWCYADVRLDANPSVIFRRRMPFGVGWRIMLLGQSQQNISQGGTYDSVNLPLLHPATASWVTNNNAYSLYFQSEVIGMQSLSLGLTAFVEQWRKFDPLTPICIVNEAVNGTSMLQFIDASSTPGTSNTRNFSQLTDKLARIGNEMSAVCMSWVTSDANAGAGIKDRMQAVLYGTGPAADDYNLTATLAAGWTFVLSPGTRHTGSNGQFDSGVSSTNGARRYEVDYANANNLFVGLPVSDYRIDNVGGPHPNGTALMGIANMMAREALSVGKALGLTTYEQPYFASGCGVMNGGRTKITITPTLPNGGSLYCPSPSDIRSFEVDNGGVGTWVSNTYTPGSFTVAKVGNTIELTKTSDSWSAGTKWRYLDNLDNRADNDGTAEDAIINSALYESFANDLMGRGLPLLGTLSGGKWIPQCEMVAV